MAEKNLKSRIVLKHDTEANWLKATNFIPLKGEIIIYDIDASHNYERIKVGDGTTVVSSLPFSDDTKVDKVSGKGLSTNDYTTTEKNKLAGIATGANKTTVDSSLSTNSTNPVQNKIVTAKLNEIGGLVGDTSVSDQISTAIVNKVDKVSGKGLSTNDYTTAEKNKLSGIASGAEVNQNAFSNVKIGTATIAADAKTDTLTIAAGSNVTITPDVTNDKITIAATDTVYTHPTYTSKSSGLYKVTVDSTGHVSAATAVTKDDITELGIPSTNTTYSTATTNAAGLMSASDKSKLDGVAVGANKTVVDSALSANSTNPVRNSVVTEEINALNERVGDTSVSEQITSATDGFIKGLSVSGKVVTYTKGDGSTGTITTQDTNTDTKVTSVGNHYTPSADSSAVLSVDASSTTSATWGSTDLVTGVNIQRDAKGHVTGITVDSIQMPANPNTDTHYTTEIRAGASGTNSNAAATNPYVKVLDNTTYRSQIQLKGGGATTVSSDANGVVTISSTDTNTTYSAATTSAAGLMSASDKKNLDAVVGYVGDESVSTQIENAIAKLVNGAPETLDTLDEIAAALEDNADIVDVLNESIGKKADQDSLTSHTSNTTVHITSTERTNWNAAKTHASSAHAPSNAEKNQNAFSNVVVGSTTIAADSATDTLTLVAGSNITLTPDATNDKVTIAAKDTVYTHPNSGVTAGTYKSVTVNAAGHVTGGSNPTTLAGYGITDAAKASDLSAVSKLVGDTAVSAQITTAIENKADTSAGQYAVTAASTDGVAYTATVPGITALTSGISFIMIPGKVSSNTSPTLNVNGLGAKPIRRRLSGLATSLQAGYTAAWLSANRPFRIVYDASGTGNWIVEGHSRPMAADLYGAVAKATADGNGNNIVDTYATIAMLQSMLPKVTNITLGTEWNGSSSPYYQDVTLSCVTETSMVDIQPSPSQLAAWQDDGLAFTTASFAGAVRVYVSGGLPTESITVQVRVQEVTVI